VVHFGVSKNSLFDRDIARTFLIIFIFVTFAFREKHGLVRNDFLDCMNELRQATKNEGQGGVQSAENANTGDMISNYSNILYYEIQNIGQIVRKVLINIIPQTTSNKPLKSKWFLRASVQ